MFNISIVLALTFLPIITKSVDFLAFSWTQAIILSVIGFLLFVARLIKFTEEIDALINSDYSTKTGSRQAVGR